MDRLVLQFNYTHSQSICCQWTVRQIICRINAALLGPVVLSIVSLTELVKRSTRVKCFTIL